MKKFLSVAFLMITVPAFAQPAPSSAPTEYNISKLTPAEIDLLGRGLGKLSYEEVAVLIQKIRQQIIEQQVPPANKEPPK